MEGGCVRELEATVMATAAELGEMQDVHICALEEAVRLIKVTDLREKEEELASSRASCTDAVRQSALGLEQTARDRIAHLSGEVAEGVEDRAEAGVGESAGGGGAGACGAEQRCTRSHARGARGAAGAAAG